MFVEFTREVPSGVRENSLPLGYPESRDQSRQLRAREHVKNEMSRNRIRPVL